MSTESLTAALNAALPDELVFAELRQIFAESSLTHGALRIEIDDARWVDVPPEAPLEVVAKTFVIENYVSRFSTGFRAQVAIGGVVSGIRCDERDRTDREPVQARYCFATLFFSRERKLITIDFHESSVWL